MMRFFLFLTISILYFGNATGQSTWELQREESGIKVWTKDYPQSDFKTFRAEATIAATLQNVVAVFLDIENMGAWYDRVERVHLVEKISSMEGIYKIDFELPWPVADRISAVRATLYHDVAKNTVTVHTEYEPDVITDSNVLLVTHMHSDWVLTPVDGGVHIYHEGFMDPGGSLPTWIANSGVKDGPIKTLKALKEILPQYSGVKVGFLE